MLESFVDFNIRGFFMLVLLIIFYKHMWTKYAASNPDGAAAAKGVATKIATQFLSKLMK